MRGFSAKGAMNAMLAERFSPFALSRMKREEGVSNPGRGPAASLRREVMDGALERPGDEMDEALARGDAREARREVLAEEPAPLDDLRQRAQMRSAEARAAMFWRMLERAAGNRQ